MRVPALSIILSTIAFIPLIAISIIRLCHEDQPNEEYKRAEAWCSKLNVIIPYLTLPYTP